MRVALVGPAVVCLALLAGCGEEETETDRVRESAQALIDSKSASTSCRELVTRRFLNDVYDGSRAKCGKGDLASLEEDGEKVSVGAIRVKGDRARVVLTVRGARATGSGHAAFAKEAGDWKLDRFGSDFVRATFRTAVANIDTKPFTTASVRRCFAKAADTLPNRRVRTLFDYALQNDPRARDLLNDIADKCPDALADALTEQVVDGLRKQGDLSAAYIRCVERNLHFNLTISGLAREALKGRVTEIGTYALAAVVKQVRKGCKGK